MRNSALQERRNRQILADIVRVYIESGEPVSSRAISKGFEESLSTATIRNVMADLEDAGFLYQPHTSAGRVPTAAAYRFFAQEIASQATITAVDREWIQREMGGATSAAENHGTRRACAGGGLQRTGHYCFAATRQDRFGARTDVASAGRPRRRRAYFAGREHAGQNPAAQPPVTQTELDATADFLESPLLRWTLEAIRGDLLQKLATEREHYEGMAQSALTLCDRLSWETNPPCTCTSKGRPK